MTAPALLIVKHFGVVKDIGTCQIACFVDAFFIRSFFKLLKIDSMTALSQPFHRRKQFSIRIVQWPSAERMLHRYRDYHE